MANIDERARYTREVPQDYYAGYYWGTNPFDSRELPGRKSDSELKIAIVNRLRARAENFQISSDSITISVYNGTVILAGRINTYRQRRLIGQEVWSINGVVKVLNDLQVTEPETAGPSKILERTE
jgi:BON domain-containing protein